MIIREITMLIGVFVLENGETNQHFAMIQNQPVVSQLRA